eukprot:103436-Chlamydomonas_euryale.AAC.1
MSARCTHPDDTPSRSVSQWRPYAPAQISRSAVSRTRTANVSASAPPSTNPVTRSRPPVWLAHQNAGGPPPGARRSA